MCDTHDEDAARSGGEVLDFVSKDKEIEQALTQAGEWLAIAGSLMEDGTIDQVAITRAHRLVDEVRRGHIIAMAHKELGLKPPDRTIPEDFKLC